MQVLMRNIKSTFSLAALLISFSSVKAQQQVTVNGVITSAATHQALRGISVTYKNISAAITDSTGSFSIKVPDYNVTVIAQGEGYQTKEIALKGSNKISAELYEDGFTSFYDQVLLPFGQESKARIPYSVSSVQTNGAWDRSFETPGSYLQGKVAGLNTVRRSGTPNIGANLFLRGYNSLNATNQPLIVVDGVIYDNTDYGSSLISNHYTDPLAFIDVRDIDNITVIKDGTSTYGTKAANGVILITTARAKELATRIDFSVNGVVNLAPKEISVLNATDYRIYVSQLLQSSGLTSTQIQALPYMNDNTSNPSYYQYHNNTDWQKEVFDKSFGNNYYLKVTGGDNIAKYALSLGYLKNKSVIKNSDLTRYNARFNADLNLSKRLTAAADLSLTFNEQNLRDQGLSTRTSPVYLSLVKSPLVSTNEINEAGVKSPAFSDVDTFNISNPLAILNNGIGLNKNYRFFGSVGFNYDILKSLSLHSTLGMTVDNIRETVFIPGKGVVMDTLNLGVANNESGSQVKRLFNLFNDTRLSYNKTFNRIHEFSANLGLRYMQSKSEQDIGQGFSSATDELKSVSFGLASLRRIGGNLGDWRWVNNYFNVNYSLSDKYFASFNLAVDGSSRFGTDVDKGALHISGNSFAVLPSFAAAWKISSEEFMKSVSLIELLKLRGSISLTGNDDIGNYNHRQYYASQNFLGIEGLVRGNIGNEQLQWEKVKKINVGLDLSLFKERINFSLDYYNNVTTQMVINEPTPTASGFIFAVTNSGGMKNHGMEASVTARVINKANLKWDVGANLAYYINRITKLPASMQTSYAGATIMGFEGIPNLFWGYKTKGVYATDAEASQDGYVSATANGTYLPFKGGDVRFVDMNGDKIIDENDQTYIGNANPDYFGSFSTRLEWKKWSLDALFAFKKGGDVYNYLRRQLESVSGFENQTQAVNNSWRNQGDITGIPKATLGDPMGNSRFSDRWLEDGSYLRLRTVTLSYDLPLNSEFFKYASIYATGNNLFTITKYLGYDPEFSSSETVFAQGIDIGLEPQFRSVQLGLRIGL